MGAWQSFVDWLREILGLEPTPVAPGGGAEPQPLRPRVLLITFDPLLQSRGGKRLSSVLGWYAVDDLVQGLISDLQECSGGLVEFQVVERIDVDAWPAKADGFSYDEDGYLACWSGGTGWHAADTLDYEAVIAQFGLLDRVESGEIDEVWLFGFPYAGFYESIMVGPGAFWCNAPPIARSDGISRRFVIMGFNYERDLGPMLESFGHRVESILRHTWSGTHGEENLWQRFIRHEQADPGRANCGWMHYAPNSRADYDWGNLTSVPSNCDDWLTFPDFRGLVRQVDCRDWGMGDMRAHHKWWFRHLPRAAGSTSGIANNWWLYGVDPNAVP